MQRLYSDFNPVYTSYTDANNLNLKDSEFHPFGDGKLEFGFDVAFGLKEKNDKGIMNIDPKYGRFMV